MKRLFVIVCMLCTGLLCTARGTAELWKQYEAAQRSDKPQKQLEILEKIGEVAQKGRLHWDFYTYWKEKVNTLSSMNWKLRDSVCKAERRALLEYGEPVVSVSSYRLWSDAGQLAKFIRENAGVLRNGANPQFWSELPDDRRRCVANDYEYAVWRCAAEDTALLRGMLMERHSGEAVDMMRVLDAIETAFDSLSTRGGRSADFRELYARCIDFDKAKKRFRGEDALLAACLSVEGITRNLTAREIAINQVDRIADTIKVIVRNIDGIVLQMLDNGRTVFETTARNPRNSFFAKDTILLAVPEIDDGDYEIVCRDASDRDLYAGSRFRKRSISLVCVVENGGWSVFACDSRTLRPLAGADLAIQLKSGTINTCVRGFDGEGFVPVPQDAAQKMAGMERGGKMVAGTTSPNGTKLLSPPVMIPQRENGCDTLCSESFFLDRPYYSLGDTVRFKVLAYRQKRGEKPEIRTNRKLTVELRSPEGDCTGSCTVTSNEFGTAEGRIAIKGRSNGVWRICVRTGSENSGNHCTTFRVEDPVLARYAVDFDDPGRTFRSGDSIEVCGILRRLDGQNVQGAELSYGISGKYTDGAAAQSGTINTDADGRFALKFKSDESGGSYLIKVTVTDGTGETDEFTTERSCAEARFSMEPLNSERGYLTLENHNGSFIVSGQAAVCFRSSFRNLAVKYRMLSGKSTLYEGSCMAGDTVRFNLEGCPDGIFTLKAVTAGERKEYCAEKSFLKTSLNARSLCEGVKLLIMPAEGNSVKVGSSTDECMACAILCDASGKTIGTRTTHIDPLPRKGGPLRELRFEGVKAEPYKVFVIVFNKAGRTLKEFSFNKKEETLPLEFENLTAELLPRQSGSISLRTEPGTEAVIAVYDKAMDSFNGRSYAAPQFMPATKDAEFSFEAGSYKMLGGTMVRALSKSAIAGECGEVAENSVYSVYEEESIPFAMNRDADMVQNDSRAAVPIVRTDFRKALAFIPFARADENGIISFCVTAADRTSTFLVDVFAHKKDLKCAVADTEIVVKIPVQIEVNGPRFLRGGDRYTLSGTIYNSTGREIRDTLKINGVGKPFSVPAGGYANFRHGLQVPRDASQITLTVSFATDAIVKEIPVVKASQPIVEAHSAVLHYGSYRDSLRSALEGQFVNFSTSEVSEKEISILDLLHEALPEQVDTSSRNAIALSGSILSAELAGIADLAVIREELRGRLAACRNADGGFGWMPEMKSSPVLTAVVLERLSRCRGFEALSHPAAAYLDSVFIRTYGKQSGLFPSICLPQYLYVRSLYPQVGFNATGVGSKPLKAFRKDVNKFLTPGKDRGLQGEIMAKARRALTLRLLASSPEGILLAEALGVKALTRSKLKKSERRDAASLREYAVKHPSGGIYFPNAVMPWRGLLESELYAHTLLHRVLGDDGICLWMMLQKETQKWSSDPACVDAVAEVLASGDTVLQTKVLALSARRDIPLEDVRASGGGMSIRREVLREGKELKDGDTLHTGERITVRCSAGSDENRSFVVLRAPVAASLRPVNQKSGFDWDTGAYRNVTPEATEYWFDVFPEEGITFSEDFFVVQGGLFASGVFTVESLYANHYRANDENCYLCSLNQNL